MNTGKPEISPSAKEWLRAIVRAALLDRIPILPRATEQELKTAGFIEKTVEIKLTQAGYALVRNLPKPKGKRHV